MRIKGMCGRSERFERRDAEHKTRRAVSPIPIEFRAVSDSGDVEGYGSVFNNEDSYGDIVAPGAFKTSILEHKAAGTMPALLYQHHSDEPVGVWTDMVEDEKGLLCTGKLLLETQRGRETHAMLKAKAISGLSIGFVARKWEWDNEERQRTVTEIDLWEVSFVTFPANQSARLTDVKSTSKIETERDLERVLRDAGYSRREATAAVAAVKSSILSQRDAVDDMESLKASAQALLTTLKGN